MMNPEARPKTYDFRGGGEGNHPPICNGLDGNHHPRLRAGCDDDAYDLATMLVEDVKRYHKEAARINADPKNAIDLGQAAKNYERASLPHDIYRSGTRITIIREQQNMEANARADLAGDVGHELIRNGVPVNADPKTVPAGVEHLGESANGHSREISDLQGHLGRVWAAHQHAVESGNSD